MQWPPKGDTEFSLELGFKIVRRGYDRVQVQDYIRRMSSTAPPAEPPSFEMDRRGYDCAQVDAYIEGLRSGAGPTAG
ncbi:hypothetical protein ACFWZ2_42880 [Streptomyces sp. NPDC059002]|uniref:hypothetical protein n=1 Tax=Streptomyces sp. NPDC059002 TaxID=3346690 RepID=UPI0036906AB4